MSDFHFYVALSLFCLAAAALVVFIRSGRQLKKNKRKLDEIGEGLAEFKPLDGKPTENPSTKRSYDATRNAEH